MTASRPRITTLPLLALAALLLASGCASRAGTGTPTDDGTITRASRDGNGIEARITFCRKVGSESGKRFGVGQIFTIGDDERVRALIDLENRPDDADRDLMFHLVWLGPDGTGFYTKRIDHPAGETSNTLASSISVPPGRRDTGRYVVQVYLFRELIAEKSFELVAAEEGEGPARSSG